MGRVTNSIDSQNDSRMPPPADRAHLHFSAGRVGQLNVMVATWRRPYRGGVTTNPARTERRLAPGQTAYAMLGAHGTNPISE
jgi:hypothetical protein